MFTYRLHGPELSSDNSDNYKKLMKRGLVEFVEFLGAHPAQKARTVAQAFNTWWLVKGPAGFRTSEDALRYKHELLQFIQSVGDGLLEDEFQKADVSL